MTDYFKISENNFLTIPYHPKVVQLSAVSKLPSSGIQMNFVRDKMNQNFCVNEIRKRKLTSFSKLVQAILIIFARL